MGGGESKTEIRYEYRDNTTEVEKREFKREKERLKKERKAREQNEKLQKQAAALEQGEFEREAEPMRKQLTDYKFGFFTNLASFRGLDISDIKDLRIAVVGPTGCGKTCFIGTTERVMTNSLLYSAFAKATGEEGTIILQEYLQQLPFRIVDTRGLFQYSTGEITELDNILYGRIKPGQKIMRESDGQGERNIGESSSIKDWIHAVIIVVKANDQRLFNETFRSYFSPIRGKFRSRGIFPITVVTHADEIGDDSDKRLEARRVASAATGSSMDHTFLISNYTPERPDRNMKIELEVLELFQFTLMVAEKYIKIAKQQIALAKGSQPTPEGSIESVTVNVFMTALQAKLKWPRELVDEAIMIFQQEDLTSVGALAMNWSYIKNRIGKLVVRLEVEKELKKLELKLE